jgi:hypothetical protein
MECLACVGAEMKKKFVYVGKFSVFLKLLRRLEKEFGKDAKASDVFAKVSKTGRLR